MNRLELSDFLSALGLNVSQFETTTKQQPKQSEFETMQEIVERVIKQNFARREPQGTSQTAEQTEIKQILNRLEKLEQNERKPSSGTFQSSEDYVNNLEDENEKLETELYRISKQYEITKRKLAVQEEQNIKLFKTAQDAQYAAKEREQSKAHQQVNGDARILAEQVHKLKEENAEILKRYETVYKQNINLKSINTDLENALEKELKNKSNQYQSGIAMAKTTAEMARLVDENQELKEKLGRQKRLSIDNSSRMADEFKRQLEEINTLRMEVDILREENFHLGDKIDELSPKNS